MINLAGSIFVKIFQGNRMEYPKLRQINAFPTRVSGREMICLQDPFKYIDKVLFVPEPAFFIITLFDGRHSLHDIQAEYMRRYGELLYTEHIERMIRELDAVFFLDNENFRNFKRGLEEEFRKGLQGISEKVAFRLKVRETETRPFEGKLLRMSAAREKNLLILLREAR